MYGYKGGGKTLACVVFAFLSYLSGKKIFSNIRLSFPFEWLNAMDIVTLSPKLNNSFVLIDEIHMLADSRLSSSYQNRAISYFFLQSRHRDCDIGYTTQMSGQCDIRIRKNTDVKIVCENLLIDSDNDGIPDIFRLVINDNIRRTTQIKRIYGTPVFKMYSSKEIVNPFDLPKAEIDKIKEKVRSLSI